MGWSVSGNELNKDDRKKSGLVGVELGKKPGYVDRFGISELNFHSFAGDRIFGA